jgi:hypothetical protein
MTNEKDLIFAVVYQSIFQLAYVDSLMDILKESYRKTCAPTLVMKNGLYRSIPQFDDEFERSF